MLSLVLDVYDQRNKSALLGIMSSELQTISLTFTDPSRPF